MRQRIETETTLKHGGMHNRVGFRAFSKLIIENNYKKARLYHFILKGILGQPHPTVEDYRKAAEAIANLLRSKGIECFGKGAWEVNEERGLHFHFMLVVEAAYGRVDWWLRVTEDGDLKTMLRAIGVAVHVAPPINDMHRVGGNKLGEMPLFQYITKSGPKLEDAIKRISYIYKSDTKDNSMKRIYYSTRTPRAKKAPATLEAPAQQPAQQATSATTTIDTNTDNGEDDMTTTSQLSPAGFKYLGTIYEACVDKGLNIVQIQDHLRSRGIHKGLATIKHDLTGIFEFAGYVEAHPAPPLETFAQIDAQLFKARPTRKAEQSLRVVSAETVKNTHSSPLSHPQVRL